MPRGHRSLAAVRSRQKAIAGALAAGLVVYASRRGFHLTLDQATAVATVVVGVVVHFVPNRRQA